jgi:hypothetical protein
MIFELCGIMDFSYRSYGEIDTMLIYIITFDGETMSSNKKTEEEFEKNKRR